MKFSAVLGFLIAAIVVYFGVSYGIDNSGVFLNFHAFIIVVGGTLAVSLICFPISHFWNMIKVLFRVLTGKAEHQLYETIAEVVEVSRLQNQGQSLDALIQNLKNPFLKESLALVAQKGLSDVELLEVLDKRVEMQNEAYRSESNTFKTIGKFPPAFGLVGTSLGMIALLQGMGESNGFERLGSSMSIALVATFYGLILANVLIIPVGENLARQSEQDLAIRRMVVDGVLLVKDKKHPLLVEEYLNSYLKPADRNRMKKAS
jgi:chemotaxis protein MotA